VVPSDCPIITEKCGVQTCEGGSCGLINTVCDDNNPCTKNYCDLLTGDCKSDVVLTCDWAGCNEALEQDPACSDGNKCTSDGCASGQCVYASFVCDDYNPCTTDTCDPIIGCIFTAVPNCQGCQADTDCHDGNYCTIDTCENATGTGPFNCKSTPLVGDPLCP
jgi:hypothetical protein